MALDGVEKVLGKDPQDDFFGMLRYWHDVRARNKNFAQVSLFLSCSTEPQLFIKNPHRSPFNVGERILLQDFTRLEIEELNQHHSSLLNSDQLSQLVEFLGGHPALIRQAFFRLAMGRNDFDSLFTIATSDDGPFGNHLKQLWQAILDAPDLKKSLRQICHDQAHEKDKNYYSLKGADLVLESSDQVVMRNRLYQLYFSEQLKNV
ncbi:AAA-like domain-containing protein [Chloroflexi bacterium TSY]|nr:AAA-like domain-containing protein [Chloroflexi bacterium TSY]